MNIVILDTGCANLSSVKFAFDRLGYRAVISRDAAVIEQADKLLLPGVGTAKAAVQQLHERQLFQTLQALDKPTLGICLGMQLMTEYSAEGGVQGLGVIDGQTVALPDTTLPLPHMGWNDVRYQDGHPLFADIPQNSYFYFVHSYAVIPGARTIASSAYGVTFSAAIAQNRFYGVQFHPERSGRVGAQLLRNFVEYV